MATINEVKEAVALTTTLTAVYTAPAGITYARVDIFRITNNSASADALYDVQFVNAAGDATAYVAKSEPFANSSNVFDREDQVKLDPGEVLKARGSETGFDCFLQVTEVTE